MPAGVVPAAGSDHDGLGLVVLVAGFAVFAAIAMALTVYVTFVVAVSVGS